MKEYTKGVIAENRVLISFMKLGAKTGESSELIKNKHSGHKASKDMVRAIGLQEKKENQKTSVSIMSQATHVTPKRKVYDLRPCKRVPDKAGEPLENQQALKRKKS